MAQELRALQQKLAQMDKTQTLADDKESCDETQSTSGKVEVLQETGTWSTPTLEQVLLDRIRVERELDGAFLTVEDKLKRLSRYKELVQELESASQVEKVAYGSLGRKLQALPRHKDLMTPEEFEKECQLWEKNSNLLLQAPSAIWLSPPNSVEAARRDAHRREIAGNIRKLRIETNRPRTFVENVMSLVFPSRIDKLIAYRKLESLEEYIIAVARDQNKLKQEHLADRQKYMPMAAEDGEKMLRALKREEYELDKCEDALREFVFA